MKTKLSLLLALAVSVNAFGGAALAASASSPKETKVAATAKPADTAKTTDASKNSDAAKTSDPAKTSDANAAETAAKQIDPAADQVVKKVSQFYLGLKSFSATLVNDMHVEAKTQSYKNDIQSVFEVKMQRPNEVSFTMKSGRLGGTAKCDGNQLVLFSPQLGDTGQYMKVDAPSDIMRMFARPEFAFVTGGMSGLSLLEALISPDPYEVLMSGVTAAKIEGKETVNGIETQHLHFTQQDLSWDMWVDTGKDPWVRKVVPDVSNILSRYEQAGKDTKMSLGIIYKDTVANPQIAASEFAFNAPAQAKEVKSFFNTAEGAQDNARALVRKPAPAINLDTIDGAKFDLASLRGKNIVVIDFWATWCPPCREGLPLVAAISKEYESKGVKFYAIDVKEEPAKIKEFLKSHNLNVDVLLDKEGTAAQAYGVMGIPQTVVIDPDGVVRDVHLGLDEDIKEKLADQFDIILAGMAAKKEAKAQ